MSFNDLKIKKWTGNSQNGTAILHTNLVNRHYTQAFLDANPALTGGLAGDYCRGFNVVSNADVIGEESFSFAVDSSYNNGALIGIQDNKSISIRIATRHCNTVATSLFCKTTSSFHPGNNNGFPAYNLQLNGGNLSFFCGNYKINGFQQTSILTGLPSAWHRLRMDVIPCTIQQKINGVFTTVPFKDIVNIYTGSGVVGSETWTLVKNIDVFASGTYYVPWGNYTSPGGNLGGYSGTITSSVGFSVATAGGADFVWIDRFEVLTGSV